VGVVHRICDRTGCVAHAERGQPQVVEEDVATLVSENRHATVDLDAEQYGEVFGDVETWKSLDSRSPMATSQVRSSASAVTCSRGRRRIWEPVA
jgi:restriction endonuclease Mrr